MKSCKQSRPVVRWMIHRIHAANNPKMPCRAGEPLQPVTPQALHMPAPQPCRFTLPRHALPQRGLPQGRATQAKPRRRDVGCATLVSRGGLSSPHRGWEGARRAQNRPAPFLAICCRHFGSLEKSARDLPNTCRAAAHAGHDQGTRPVSALAHHLTLWPHHSCAPDLPTVSGRHLGPGVNEKSQQVCWESLE